MPRSLHTELHREIDKVIKPGSRGWRDVRGEGFDNLRGYWTNAPDTEKLGMLQNLLRTTTKFEEKHQLNGLRQSLIVGIKNSSGFGQFAGQLGI